MRRLSVPLAVATLMTAALPIAHAACEATSTPTSVALVELYTSQGCSSCPPADRWLSQLAKQGGPRAIPLAFHVGYWDYIGWKDPYARPEFNERQSRLAAANGSRSVYTPGVFVQGREARRWHDAREFYAQVRSINQRAAGAKIMIDQVKMDGRRVEMRVRSELVAPAVSKRANLFVALVESGLSTRVTAGENRGEKLSNDRVVRSWSGPLQLGTQSLELQASGSTTADLALVAFVEDEAGVLQTLQLPLRSCGPS
ncbi:MAG: DUF1223 domain-containing protein [Burkholderiaceae bacterium]